MEIGNLKAFDAIILVLLLYRCAIKDRTHFWYKTV